MRTNDEDIEQMIADAESEDELTPEQIVTEATGRPPHKS